jgi:ABC-type amino acid transport substrate-binding protein
LPSLLAVAMTVAVASARAADTLRVLSSLDWPPLTLLDKNGEPSGFEVGFAQAICAELNRRCEIVNTPFEDIIPALLAGRGDVIVSDLSITEERRQKVAFTVPYMRDLPQTFLAGRGYGHPVTAEGLRGEKIGVSAGSVQESYLAKNFPQSRLVPIPAGVDETGLNRIFAALGKDEVDLALVDSAVALTFIESPAGNAYAMNGDPIYGDDWIGMAVRKNDEDLRQKLNAAIVRLRLDGTYKKINAKYFPFDLNPGF